MRAHYYTMGYLNIWYKKEIRWYDSSICWTSMEGLAQNLSTEITRGRVGWRRRSRTCLHLEEKYQCIRLDDKWDARYSL